MEKVRILVLCHDLRHPAEVMPEDFERYVRAHARPYAGRVEQPAV